MTVGFQIYQRLGLWFYQGLGVSKSIKKFRASKIKGDWKSKLRSKGFKSSKRLEFENQAR